VNTGDWRADVSLALVLRGVFWQYTCKSVFAQYTCTIREIGEQLCLRCNTPARVTSRNTPRSPVLCTIRKIGEQLCLRCNTPARVSSRNTLRSPVLCTIREIGEQLCLRCNTPARVCSRNTPAQYGRLATSCVSLACPSREDYSPGLCLLVRSSLD
jgi:hypothetical protein